MTFGIVGNGIAYSDKLVQQIIDSAKDSEIVKAQRDTDHNVITMEKLDETAKTDISSLYRRRFHSSNDLSISF